MKHLRSRWKRREIILLLERFELYVSAGMPVVTAISALGQGAKPAHCAALGRVEKAVESGVPFSRALGESITVSQTVVALISHGEASGSLTQAALVARTILEQQDDVMRKCASAMMYPCIIGTFACLLTIGLVRGVMPQIIPMLNSLHVPLPFLTRAVIAVSESMLSYGLLACIAIIVIAVAAVFIYRKTTGFRMATHAILIRVPVVGRIISGYSLSSFLRSCGALVESGLSSTDSYARAAGTVALLPLRKSLLHAEPRLRRGVSLGAVMMQPSVPPYVPSLLSAGESSGSLGRSISRAATIIDRDLDHALKRLTALIEPCMMIGMGCAVGSIALSIMMPIYDISRVLQK